MHRLLQLLRTGPGQQARTLQHLQRDQSLRQHAQLTAAVHIFCKAGRLHDVLRHLAQPLVGVHGGGAQDVEGVVVRQVLGLHQDALGALHQLALFKAGREVCQGLGLGLLLAKAGLGQVDQCAQALCAIAIDHIAVDARHNGAVHMGYVGIGGEHDDGAGCGLRNGLGRLEQCIVWRRHIANEHIWCMAHHFLQQLGAVLHHGQYRDAGRSQIGLQHLRSFQTIHMDQGRRHKTLF